MTSALAPGLAPDAATFQNNLMTTYNVFSAATLLGIQRVVWASSETLFGLPLTREAPKYAPTQYSAPARDDAEIRAFREPEPYKGKGVRYAGEHVQRKEGKTVQ